jgi:hypothetical protein
MQIRNDWPVEAGKAEDEPKRVRNCIPQASRAPDLIFDLNEVEPGQQRSPLEIR